MILPEKLDVLTVHARLIAETGGTSGLRDEALLESALAAAYHRHRYESADVVSCAATYAYHLTQTHAFFDGNKRVAAAVTEAFLETNGRAYNVERRSRFLFSRDRIEPAKSR
jgi:death on curing protein